VLGLGESGEAAARLLAGRGFKVTVLDSAPVEKLREKIDALAQLGVSVLTGADAERDATPYDLGVISPGIDPATLLVRNFLEKKIELIGELEMSFELCKKPVVAITGTNGKTTTTTLVSQMLNSCGVRTIASGNISPAFAAIVEKCAELDVVTLEVSSFQLEQIRAFRPSIAVWLNFSPNHLDRYRSVEEYRAAKLRIFENQTAEDFAVVNLRDAWKFLAAPASRPAISGVPAEIAGGRRAVVAGAFSEKENQGDDGASPSNKGAQPLADLRAQLITFSAYESGGDFELRVENGDSVIFFRGEPVLQMSNTRLRGAHNAENLMAALGVGFARGLSFAQMAEPLSRCLPPPHRCELIRTLDGVDYVNDSKSTSLDSLEKALMAETRPVTLIAGGKDKGFEFDPLTDLVAKKCSRVILIGEMASRIEASWRARVHTEKASGLRDAVLRARAGAGRGEVVLFSPGTSSFDMFKSYIDRGEQFREIVQSLT